MPAYNNLDEKIQGLIYGLHPRKIESWRAAEDIGFGEPVFSYNDEDYSKGQGSVWKKKVDVKTITLDADLVTSNVITTTLTIDGVAQTPVATTFDTDHDTTMDNHKADLEAAFSGLTVTLTDATNNRQFTLFYKGSNIDVASVVTLGASQAGITIASGTSPQIFIGVTVFTQKSLKDSVGYYEQDEAINVMTSGQIWVYASKAVNPNTAAYVIIAAGATQNQFTDSSSGTYDTKARFRSLTTAAGLVLLEVRGQN